MRAHRIIKETSRVLARLCIVIGACLLGDGEGMGWVGLAGGFFLLATEA